MADFIDVRNVTVLYTACADDTSVERLNAYTVTNYSATTSPLATSLVVLVEQ